MGSYAEYIYVKSEGPGQYTALDLESTWDEQGYHRDFFTNSRRRCGTQLDWWNRGLPVDLYYPSEQSGYGLWGGDEPDSQVAGIDYYTAETRSWTWVSLAELIGFDYETMAVWSLSTMSMPPYEEIEHITFRDALGPDWFNHLTEIQNAGTTHILIGAD